MNFSKSNRDKSSSSESESEDEGTAAPSAVKTRPSTAKKSVKEFRHWSDNEIRAFVKSFKKFPNAENRLQEVAEDADLHEKSMTDLKNMWHRLKDSCENAVCEANKENAGVKTSKSASFKIKGVAINATQLLKSQEDFESLVKVVSVLDSAYK